MGDPAPAVPTLRLIASPNPSRGPVRLQLEGAAAGASRVVVLDVSGRVVRHLGLGESRTQESSAGLSWDGRSDAGTRAENGVYFVRSYVSGIQQSMRVVYMK